MPGSETPRLTEHARKALPCIAVVLAFVAGLVGISSAAEPPPNIVLILADDLGYGDLGCYGQKVIQTPRIDRLAAEGRRFLNAYAGSTVCAPARCALMTGLHTGHCRVRGNALVPLEPDDVTVAELLNSAGYTTALVGKWGLGEPETTGIPNRQGFDYFFGYLNQRHAHDYHPEYLWRNTERVTLSGNLDGKKEQYSHDLFTEEALQFIRQHRDEPFFLYLAYTIPHANNELGRETGNGMEVPSDEPYTDRDWPQQQKNHAAMITRLDGDVGRVVDLLDELDLSRRTLVVFTSDNGPHREGGADPDFFNSNGPLKGIKRDLYEGGIRVPMIARWPGVVPAGTDSQQVCAFWDFLPTAAELAGVEVSNGIDGVSIVPALKGDAFERNHLYWEFHERGFQQAARHGRWKAVRKAADAPLELYDLDDDIGETKNVASEHPLVVNQFDAYLQSARTESKHFPVKATGGGR